MDADDQFPVRGERLGGAWTRGFRSDLAPDLVQGHDVWVRYHGGLPPPAVQDLGGGSVRQGEDHLGGRDEHAELQQMLPGIPEVRVVEVVHRQHQRRTGFAQHVDSVLELRQGERLETEVHVEDVRPVGPQPAGVHGTGRPPLVGRRPGDGGIG